MTSQLRKDFNQSLTESGFTVTTGDSYNDKHKHVRRIKLIGQFPTDHQLNATETRMKSLYPNRDVRVYVNTSPPFGGMMFRTTGVCLKINNQ